MKHSLERGDDVLISGFGKFQVKEKKAAGQEPGHRWKPDSGPKAGCYIQVFRKIAGSGEQQQEIQKQKTAQ